MVPPSDSLSNLLIFQLDAHARATLSSVNLSFILAAALLHGSGAIPHYAGDHNDQVPWPAAWLHADRTPRCHRDYRDPDRPVAACGPEDPRGGQPHEVQQQPAPDGPCPP